MRLIFSGFLATLAVVVLCFWIFRKPDEAAVIKEFLVRGAALASYDEIEPPFQRLAVSKEISELFTEHASFVIVSTESEKEYAVSRNEIKDRMVAVRTSLAQLAVSFNDLKVTIDEDTAKVTATSVVIGRDQGREDFFMEKHPVEVLLHKTEDGWKIAGGENLDVIDLGAAEN